MFLIINKWNKFIASPVSIIVIAVCMILWQLLIPAIVGFGLIIIKYLYDQESGRLRESIKELETIYYLKNEQLQTIYNEKVEQQEMNFKREETIFKKDIGNLHSELKELEKATFVSMYDFSEYAALTSQDCKNRLSILQIKEKILLKIIWQL